MASSSLPSSGLASTGLASTGLASTRTLEWIAGADGLASSPAAATEQLSALGPILSLVEPAAEAAGPDGATLLPAAATGPANRAVLDAHAAIETLGHEAAPLNGPLHGLTGLGETVGLGYLGTPGNLLTDATGTHPAAGGADAAAPLLADAGRAVDAAGALAESGLAVPASGNGLVGPGGTLEPVTDGLNRGVLDLHATLEEVGHQNPALNGPIHGLTGLGETIGLGYVGNAGNLVTDALDLPGSVLGGGGVGAAVPLVTDLGHVVGAAGTLVGSLTGAAGASGGLLAPVTNLANAAILDLHAGLEGLGHDILPLNAPLHGLTGLGETIGLGHLGTPGNLVTDALGLPGSVLGGGGVGAAVPLVSDLGNVVGATGTLVGSLTGAAGAGGGPLAPAGALAPVAGLANAAVLGVHAGLEGVGHDILPLNDAIHGLTGLGETVGLGHLGTPGTLLTDTANLPGSVLDGGGVSGVAPILGDAAATTHAAGTLLDGVTGIPGALAGGTGGGAEAGLLAPVVSAVSGVAGGTGALGGLGSTPVGSLLGDATGGGAGNTHALVEAGVGPQTATPAADAGLLAATPEPAHTVQVDAIGVGADQPTLVSVHVLDGGSLPVLPNAGADALAGALHDVAPTAPAAVDPAPSHAALDLGVAAIDLGGLAGAHHADPAGHGAGTHLLGL